MCWHLNLYITPLFCSLLSLSCGCHEEYCCSVCAFKMNLYPIVVTCVLLNFLPSTCMYGTTMEVFLLLVLLLVSVLLLLVGWLNDHGTWFIVGLVFACSNCML